MRVPAAPWARRNSWKSDNSGYFSRGGGGVRP
jgi:hypothetical protein